MKKLFTLSLFIFSFVCLWALQPVPGPTVDAGTDVTIPLGGSTQLNATGNVVSFSWSPATGLSATNIANPVASPGVTTTYTVTGTIPCTELLANPGFESGNTGFSSQYTYYQDYWFSSTELTPAASYGVGTDAHNYHTGFYATPHTGSYLMVVNGATTAGMVVWQQTVSVLPNNDFLFSMWAHRMAYDNAKPELQLIINGVNVGSPFIVADASWVQFTRTWNSGGSTSATIQIVDLNLSAGDNDFSLDDASFTYVTCGDWTDDVIVTVDFPPVIVCPPDMTVPNEPGLCGATVNYLLPEITDDGCHLPDELTNCDFIGEYNGHHYFILRQSLTWPNSKAAAEALGGYLAIFETAAENGWVNAFLNARYPGGSYWIGGHQDPGSLEPYGGWKWINGTPVSYVNWYPAEPNNGGYIEQAMMVYCSDGKWRDDLESNARWPVFEFSCLTPVLKSGPASGAFFPPGTTTVTYATTDAIGNTSECSFDVEVQDAEPPHFGEVGPIKAINYAGKNFGNLKYAVEVPKIQFNWDYGSPSPGLLGTDQFSIRYLSSFTVPVTGAYKFRAVTDDGFRLWVNNILVMDFWIDQDNPSRAAMVNLTAGATVPVRLDFYENALAAEVALYYTVPGGVEKLIELKSNVIANQERDMDPGACTYTAKNGEFDPLFGDNCSATLVNDFNGSASLNGAEFPNGSTEVTWTVTDGAGQSASFTFTVTVTDNQLPGITCPDDMTVATDADQCYATITDLGAPSLSDNCGIDEGSPTNDAPANQQYSFGEHTVTWTVYDVNGNSNSCSQTITVDKVTTVTTVNVEPTTQQYSDLVTFTATVTPYQCDGAGTAATTVTFYVGDQAVGTAGLVAGVAQGTFPLLETEDPDDPLFGEGDLKPGVKTVTAVFNEPDTEFIVDNPTTTLTVTCENAAVEYTGGLFFSTNPTGYGWVYPEAYVEDAVDGHPGDIRNATVTFRIEEVDGDPLGEGDIPVGLIEPEVTTEGYASDEAAFQLNSAEMAGGGREWTIWTIVNNYYCGAVSQAEVITLAMPGPDYVTGGGYSVLTSAVTGQYPGAEGTKMNFGFVMKWNSSGKNLQGRVNIIYRGPDGNNYQIKSNAINSLVISTSGDYKMAVITTKATLKRIYPDGSYDDLGGNLTLTMNAWESIQEQTGKLDMVSVQLAGAKGTGIYFSSNFVKGKTLVQLLDGGKIQVRDETAVAEVASKSAQIGPTDQTLLEAYPNPFTDRVVFEFSPAVTGKARIDILDLNGRLIRTVFDQTVESGNNYQATFEPVTAVEGLYLYRATIGNDVSYGKLIKQ